MHAHVEEDPLYQGNHTGQHPGAAEAEAETSKNMHRPRAVAEQEPDNQQIEQHPEGARQAILCASCPARMVAHRNLHHLRPFHGGVSRDKAVRIAIEMQLAQQVGAVRFQAASVVMQVRARQARDQPVRHAAWKQASKEAVLPVDPPAAHHIAAFADFRQQQRNIGRIVLQVGIHGDHHGAPGRPEAGDHGCRLAIVAAEAYGAEGGIAPRHLEQHGPASVAAAVIDQDRLPLFAGVVKGLQKGGLQGGEILGLVANRYHQAQIEERARGLPRQHGRLFVQNLHDFVRSLCRTACRTGHSDYSRMRRHAARHPKPQAASHRNDVQALSQAGISAV